MHVVLRQKHTAMRDILQGKNVGRAEKNALMLGEIHGPELAVIAGFRGGKPDFISLGRPGQAHGAGPAGGEERPLSREIDDDHGTAVITMAGMIDEGDQLSVGRKARIGDITGGGIEHLADGKLQLGVTIRIVHHS